MTAIVETPSSPAEAPPKPPLFGKAEKRAILDPLWDNNPIALQILGICSALAVTIKLETTIVMCIGVIVVVCMSNTVISMMRHWIPSKIRIIIELVVIASLTSVVDVFLQAYAYGISKQMSVFIGLIVTNCIVMGRAEAFAMANPPFRSFLDGLGNTLGYSWILLTVAVVRELLGSGKLLGHQIIPHGLYAAEGGFYSNNGLMVLAPGAFFMLGIIIWIQRSLSGYSEKT
jgi:Na+-transporting NADH:ubiquinone oxidoreductase subunit D